MPDTGSPRTDAKTDFSRERRRRALAKIVSRLRSEPDDVSTILPFEEVVGALGRRAQRDLGVQTIPLDTIVGTVDRGKGEFDRSFRPTTTGVRGRWEGIAEARRRGVEMPPIDVYRIGDLHFVQDGHHRVSVARAHGDTHIDARVTEVDTQVGSSSDLLPRQLPLTSGSRCPRRSARASSSATSGATRSSPAWSSPGPTGPAWRAGICCRAPRWPRPGSARSTCR
jgi:hypothetical protein